MDGARAAAYAGRSGVARLRGRSCVMRGRRLRARLVAAGLAASLVLFAARAVRADARPAEEGSSETTWDVDEELVVTATRIREARGEKPFQASVLSGEELDLGLSPSVADALRFVPGLHLVQEGATGGRAALSLRGLDPNHVVVLVDGVRVNDPTNTRGGSFDPSTLALVDLERVEIVRGPLSAIHGADALAGVIQIVTRGVEPDDALHARVRSRIGRFHRAEVAARASAGVGGVAGLALGAGLETSRDPRSDGGFDAASFHAKLRVPLPGAFAFEGFTRIHGSSARAFPESSGGPELAVLRAMEDRDVREILVGALLARPFLGGAPGLRIQLSRASRREDLESPGISSGALPGNVADIVPASRAGDEYQRWDLSLVGDGGFGQNPSVLATAREMDLGIVWIVMNNNAFGTIAGLQAAHYGLTYGTTFESGSDVPDYAAIARAYGVAGIRVTEAAEFRPAVEQALASNEPALIDVAMVNNPTPTSGHWNILDIYSPGKQISHVATE